MSMQTMAKADQALKLFYLDGIRNQLNNANPILSVMDRDHKSVSGSDIAMALRYGRNGGVGNRTDDGNLPTPNSRKTKQAKWPTKNIFARIQLTDKTVKASRSNKGAFINLLEAELEDAKNDAQDSFARQMFGDGTGKLANLVTNATASNVLGVDSVQYLVEGQLIDVLDSNGNVKEANREVVLVDDIASEITVSGTNFTVAAGDFITVNESYGEELTGFESVFTPDNTIYGIDRSQNKWFNPQVHSNTGTLSEVAIQQAIDDADRKAGGKTNFLLSSYGVRRAYQELLLSTKRTTDVMELKGGWKTLAYNDMPFTVDKYAKDGTLLGLDLSTWKLYHIEDWNWLDDDGAVLSRVSDKAAWEAALVRYADMGCSKPRGNFKMSGITEA